MKRIARYNCRNGNLIRGTRRPSFRRGRHTPVNITELHEITMSGMKAGLLDHKSRIDQLIRANNDFAEVIESLHEEIRGEKLVREDLSD